MKKNIIIGLLIVVSFFSLTIAFYQKFRADKLEETISKELLIKETRKKNIEEVMQEMMQKINAQKDVDSTDKEKKS